jgi:hypothetical protein
MSDRTRMPHRLAPAVAVIAAAGALHGPVAAQSSPYYIGVAQSFTHDSNIVRLRDDQPAPPGVRKSDTVSSTALVAGIDQPVGRGRLAGQAALRDNRFANNGQYDSNGYSLNLALDWATVERISGQVGVSAGRTPQASVRDRFEQPIPGRNVQTTQGLNARVSVGLVTQWSAELALERSSLSYSAAQAAFREYDQDSTSAGVAWRPSAATRLSASLSRTRTDYPNLLLTGDPNDRRTRNSLDLGVQWQPGGVSALDASISRGKTEHARFAERDFSATFGSLGWTWRPTGKLNLRTRLSRDTGQDGDVLASAFSRTTDQLRLEAGYAISAKVSLTAAASTNRRTLEGTALQVSGVTGRDTGRSAELGVRWAPLRALSTGCTLGSDRRGRNSNPLLVDPFRSSTTSCFAQFVLQ